MDFSPDAKESFPHKTPWAFSEENWSVIIWSAAQVNNAVLLHGVSLTSNKTKHPQKNQKQLYKCPHLHIDTYIRCQYIRGAEHQSTQGK